jgi:predicted membrane protein
VLGIMLVLLGTLILLENVGLISNVINNYIFSWQMLLIAIGVINLSHRGHNVFGFVLIGIGALFMILKVFDISYDLSSIILPSILVGIGVLILFKRHRNPDWDKCDEMTDRFRQHEHHFHAHFCRDQEENKDYSSTDCINDFNFFSGAERVMNTKNFRGGRVTSIFGGSTYDLLNCDLAEGENVLDVVHVFGGMKLLAPSDWQIHMDVVTIFGGYADKRRSVVVNPEKSSKILRIKGIAIFGGGEIKNI